jgi:ribonuclease HI
MPIDIYKMQDIEIVNNSLSVDAGYSSKTGIMDYRGIWTDTGELYFEKKFYVGTNNLGEFLAVVHALAQMKKDGLNNPIYTDSVTAMAWVKNKKANTKLELNESTLELWDVINRAEEWLKLNSYSNSIFKWKTKKWGEIKADYNRK